MGPSGMNESLYLAELAVAALALPPPLLWMCCAAIFQEDHPRSFEDRDDVIVTRNRT